MGKADERMLALWHALDATELGLTKQEIRRMVPGYGLDTTDSAFEKMFTRDKDALRGLGTAIETYTAGSGSERYRLAASAGPVIDLTLAEAAAVRLAASIWAAGDLSDQANEAAQRVTGTGLGARKNATRSSSSRARQRPEPPSPEELEALAAANDAALIAHVPASSSMIKPLLAAISERRRVRFGYRSGVTGKVIPRLVEPWRVAFRDGGWYLLGRDAELTEQRGSQRAFRLSRVVGDIKNVTGAGAFVAPAEIDVSAILGETGHTIAATLALLPGRGARLRALATEVTDDKYLDLVPDGYEPLMYRYDDEREFADELAGLGENVVVLGPPQLRAAVVKRLKAAAAWADAAGPIVAANHDVAGSDAASGGVAGDEVSGHDDEGVEDA